MVLDEWSSLLELSFGQNWWTLLSLDISWRFPLKFYSIFTWSGIPSFLLSLSQTFCQFKGKGHHLLLYSKWNGMKYSDFHVPCLLFMLDLSIPKIILCSNLIIPFIWCFTTCEVLLQTLFYLNLMINYIDGRYFLSLTDEQTEIWVN